MNKTVQKLLTIFGCVLLALYLLVAVAWSRFMAADEPCGGLEGGLVEVIDPDNVGFVTAAELTAGYFGGSDSLQGKPFSQIDLADIQHTLRSADKLEWAEVTRLANNKVKVRVWPLKPVARIWPDHGRGYYVNRQGKRIMADPKFRLDVAQVTGTFDSLRSEAALMPLLDALVADPDMDHSISMIDASDTTNIIMVPAFRGHVVNMGSVRNADSKLQRLRAFYRQVLPHKGWNFYDTISVKWDGQVVATRRHGKIPDLTIPLIDELEHEQIDQGTMQSLPD